LLMHLDPWKIKLNPDSINKDDIYRFISLDAFYWFLTFGKKVRNETKRKSLFLFTR